LQYFELVFLRLQLVQIWCKKECCTRTVIHYWHSRYRVLRVMLPYRAVMFFWSRRMHRLCFI